MVVFVIAEVGSSHDGSHDKMARLIHAARHAGADACKFQWTSAPAFLAARRGASDYESYDVIGFPRSRLEWLKAMCEEESIEFMCTVYLPEDIAIIAQLVKRFKIASFEACDRNFVRAHFPHRKEIIISTGMTGDNERSWFYGLGSDPTVDVRVLHCVSAYPAPPEEMNLAAIGMHEMDGLSDHTTSVLTGAVAVGAGARILEKHLRLDDTDPGNPDFLHSLPPREFAQYVENVRFAEQLMGDGEKRPMPSEVPMMKYRVMADQ